MPCCGDALFSDVSGVVVVMLVILRVVIIGWEIVYTHTAMLVNKKSVVDTPLIIVTHRSITEVACSGIVVVIKGDIYVIEIVIDQHIIIYSCMSLCAKLFPTIITL